MGAVLGAGVDVGVEAGVGDRDVFDGLRLISSSEVDQDPFGKFTKNSRREHD
jgi:hypothetical protein